MNRLLLLYSDQVLWLFCVYAVNESLNVYFEWFRRKTSAKFIEWNKSIFGFAFWSEKYFPFHSPPTVLLGIRDDVAFGIRSRCISHPKCERDRLNFAAVVQLFSFQKFLPEKCIGCESIVDESFDENCWFIDSVDCALGKKSFAI